MKFTQPARRQSATQNTSKKTIRSNLLTRRKSLSIQAQKAAEKKLQHRISKLRIVTKASSIGVYISHEGELNLAQFTKWAWKQKKKIFLPVVSTKLANKSLQNQQPNLKFVLHTPRTRFKKNRYGIPEPKTLNAKQIKFRKLDIIFVPLVAFTSKGKRIGMGGGYYDKAFQFKQKFSFLKPKLIGVGYEWQLIDSFLSDPWDIRLDSVLTDRKEH